MLQESPIIMQSKNNFQIKIRGRSRYQCTNCGSVDHLDNVCPQRKAPNNRGYGRERAREHFIDVTTPHGQVIPFCVDSGTGLSLIQREILQSLPQTDQSRVSHGVSKGNMSTTQFINIPITLISQERQESEKPR